jgi:hypothetical protein
LRKTGFTKSPVSKNVHLGIQDVMGKKRVYFIHVSLVRLFFKGFLMEMREERRILIKKIVAIYASQ